MAIEERRERERAQRHRLIVRTARDIAESEGWDAVTVRRLAREIEYSQPVLYGHFPGKEAIVRAVAIEAFDELGELTRAARAGAADPRAALRALAEAYLAFAAAHPALYEAMFVRPLGIPFGTAETPAPLRSAFAEIVEVVTPFAGGTDTETATEVLWSGLHGLATLGTARRLRPDQAADRLDRFLTGFTGPPTGSPAGPPA
ncbi:TetR/AcrR family transcriptional regulator [Myceligenerans crystallogenes]|uniref:TetR/AcrR family transcriptional regulator n=1 Tax=Myceligenerans crystallogenes TaxID=316335 RepID=A0ABP4ZQS1_9MICO